MTIERLIENKGVSPDEADTATINLETAQRKMELLRGIAEAAHETAKAELAWAERLYETGYAAQSEITAAGARLKVLQLILDTKE